MNQPDAAGPPPAEPRPPRRSRADLEALAADFVNSGIHRKPQATPRWVRLAVFGGAGAGVLLLLLLLFEPAVPPVEGPGVRQADVGKAWADRIEADRERSRQESEQAKKHLGKLAASDAACVMHVSEVTRDGTLTYDAAKRMEGARTDEAGHVFLPPVVRNDGRRVIYEVFPNGCVRVNRVE